MLENFSNCNVWGFPAYELEPKLNNPGAKIPKWDPRSHRWNNIGFSKMHSMKVELVLNL